MTWFETLTGFPEESPQQVRENICVDMQTLTSHRNGKVLVVLERFIVTTLPSSMDKPANQQITKSTVLRISEPHWEIPRAVCGK